VKEYKGIALMKFGCAPLLRALLHARGTVIIEQSNKQRNKFKQKMYKTAYTHRQLLDLIRHNVVRAFISS
jgi:hypothetical protein